MGKKTSKTAHPFGFRHPAGGRLSQVHAPKNGKDHKCDSGDILADRQTDRQTDVLTTIFRHHSRGQSNKVAARANSERIANIQNKSSAVAEMGDRGHNRHGPKRGGGCDAPFAGGAGSPSNTM